MCHLYDTPCEEAMSAKALSSVRHDVVIDVCGGHGMVAMMWLLFGKCTRWALGMRKPALIGRHILTTIS